MTMPKPTTTAPRSATIEITIALDLRETDLFPDGVPDGWTAQTVVDEIKKSGTAARFLEEWDALAFGLHVEVNAGTDTARVGLP